MSWSFAFTAVALQLTVSADFVALTREFCFRLTSAHLSFAATAGFDASFRIVPLCCPPRAEQSEVWNLNYLPLFWLTHATTSSLPPLTRPLHTLLWGCSTQFTCHRTPFYVFQHHWKPRLISTTALSSYLRSSKTRYLLAIVIFQNRKVSLLNLPRLDPAFPPNFCSLILNSHSPQSPQNPVRLVNQGFAQPRRSHSTLKLDVLS